MTRVTNISQIFSMYSQNNDFMLQFFGKLELRTL